MQLAIAVFSYAVFRITNDVALLSAINSSISGILDDTAVRIIAGSIASILSTPLVDIYSKRRGIAGSLSNFTPRSFVFDDVPCRSTEGALQSFKFKDIDMQKFIYKILYEENYYVKTDNLY